MPESNGFVRRVMELALARMMEDTIYDVIREATINHLPNIALNLLQKELCEKENS